MHAQCVDGEDVYRKVDTVDCAGCGVTVAVAAEHGDAALGQALQRCGMQPGPGAGCVPGAQRGAAPAVADAHEQQVPLADADVLRMLCLDQVGRG